MTGGRAIRTVASMTEQRMIRRDEVASAAITAWTVTGLFLDGWAHNVDKPETFFTPWHGVLYSGFLAAVLWSVREGRRSAALGEPGRPLPPMMRVGMVLFAVGGTLDMVWHEIFGIEESVEALLSPTHLVLMTGGLFLATGTVRSALARRDRSPSFRQFAPALTGIMYSVAIVAFFLQFASAFRIEDHAFFASGATEDGQVSGVLSVLVTNSLLVGTVAWALRQFRPPAGSFTVVLGGTALMVAGLHSFHEAALVLAAVAAGVAADALLVAGRSSRTILLAVPGVLWTTWFAVYHLVWGLGWPIEMWTGSIVFAVLTGYGLSLLASPADELIAANGEVHTPRRVLAQLLT